MQTSVVALVWLACTCTSIGFRVRSSSEFSPVAAFSVAAPGLSRGTSADPNSGETATIGRRQALGHGLAAAAAAVAGIAAGVPTVATAAEPTVKIYFGAGCFWHVQHELVGEEMAALSRNPTAITSVSGYAGGTRRFKGDENSVCYHNPFKLADYGKLGHAEVVQVEIPESQIPRFAEKYFSLFGSKGRRHDPQDQGGEYRSAIGLPGGDNSPHYAAIKQAASGTPMRLYKGAGNEGDTLRDQIVLVYDSEKFPFYAAEVYHQFHNDFMGPAYGFEYNKIQRVARERGLIKETSCPELKSDWVFS